MKKQLLQLSALALCGLAFAHHINVGLSNPNGEEIMTHVVVYHQPSSGNIGVPPYATAHSAHEHSTSLADGDSFQFISGAGLLEEVVFSASDFADIANATDQEVVASINDQLVTGEVLNDNGHFLFRSFLGGPLQTVTLSEGNGGLAKLDFAAGTSFGSPSIELTLSIPADEHEHEEHAGHEHGLEGAAYVVLASDQPGSFQHLGQEIPLAFTPTTRRFLAAARQGLLPGFIGTLDRNADAMAEVPVELLQPILGPELPDALYFSYFVISHGEIAFVSNVFTADIVSE